MNEWMFGQRAHSANELLASRAPIANMLSVGQIKPINFMIIARSKRKNASLWVLIYVIFSGKNIAQRLYLSNLDSDG